MKVLRTIKARLGYVAVLALALVLSATAAFAQVMPQGSGYDCDGAGAGTAICYDDIGGIMSSSVSDFTTLVVDIAPYLFGGLVSVLLIHLAIRWFGRVTRSV